MPTSPRQRSRRWIVFFLALAVLGIVAIVSPLLYNLSIQLRPEQLAEARQRWQQNAPADYDLACLVQTLHGGQEEKSQHVVMVRGGRVAVIVEHDEIVYLAPWLAAAAGPGALGLSRDEPQRYGVPALFDQIEAALRQDEEAGKRNFTKADFDARDGHPRHFIHYLGNKKERIEWFVKLTRVSVK